MSRGQLQDAQARLKIERDLDTSILVEAGAGSGKTYSLVKRMVALIREGECEPENLAAVTFTRKAAGELRERFQVELEKELEERSGTKNQDRLVDALEKLDKIFLGTIHSFCSRLLRERPLEAGLDPDFTEIEGLEEEMLRNRAWDEFLKEVQFTHGEKLTKIRELDLEPQDLKTAYEQLILYPEVEMVTESRPYPKLREARQKLEEFTAQIARCLPAKEPEKGWDGVQRLFNLIQLWQKRFNLSSDIYLLRLFSRLNRQRKVTYNRWPAKETGKMAEELFTNFRDKTVIPALKSWWEHRHSYLIDFLKPAVEKFQNLRLSENLLNFQDLLLYAASLLRENSEVRSYFQNRYTHLLVDEFQDTDPVQAEIMMYLTAQNLQEKDWTRLSPKPGALFVVGDPKQSIYRFRRADIDIYNQVKKIMEKQGEVLYLSTNFRSLPDLVGWANDTFTTFLGQESPPYQAEYVPMHKHRQEVWGAVSGIKVMECEKVDYHKQELIVEGEAARLARWIKACLNGGLEVAQDHYKRPARPHDFLILTAYKKYLHMYARALERQDIPYNLVGGSSMDECRELQELMILLQALADPNNSVALVAALRGDYFGFSDRMLYDFKIAGGNFNFLAPLPANLQGKIEEEFSSMKTRMNQYYKWSKNLPPSAALEKIIEDLGIVPLALTGELGKGRVGFILQALEMVRHIEGSWASSFSHCVEFLSNLLAAGAEEELDPEGSGPAGVRIMNLHKVKGLQAPIVILANPGANPQHEPNLHVKRKGKKPKGYLMVTDERRRTLALPPGWEEHAREEKKYEDGERKRLLYVATTRARDLLVVSTYKGKPAKSPWYPLETYLPGNKLEEPCEEGELVEKNKKKSINIEDFQKGRQAREDRLQRWKTPSYQSTTVTELRKDLTKIPARQKPGRGAAWGNVMHRVLEHMVRAAGRLPGDKFIQEVLEKEGEEASTEEVLKHLRKLKNLCFWQRMEKGQEILTEVPLGSWQGNVYITGTVDLAFKEGGKWVLVDYKTDVVEDEEHEKKLLEFYLPQLQAYSKYWQEITGESVKEAGFLFTHICKYSSCF